MTGPQAIQIIEALGISQAEFARRAGLHPNSVTKWANGGKVSGPAQALLSLLRDRPELINVMGSDRK